MIARPSPVTVLAGFLAGIRAIMFISQMNVLMGGRRRVGRTHSVSCLQRSARFRRRGSRRSFPELGAYGILNLAAGIFGAPMSVGIPARSVANVRCGATTSLSNILHAVFLCLLVANAVAALWRTSPWRHWLV